MTKSKGKKTGIIIGAVIGVIVIILLISFFALTGSATTVAYLNVEAGDVQVNFGKGWIPATDGMELGLKDGIKTGPDGEASLVLYESAIVSLEPDTEISIEDLSDEGVKLKQDSGSTWNKFTGLSGLKGLEVETPDTVATVRGTEFGVHNREGISVMEGEVKARNKQTGEEYGVGAGRRAYMENGMMKLGDLTPEQRAKLLKKMEKTLERLKAMRQREMDKNPRLVNIAKKRMNLDDAGLMEKLRQVDDGKYNVDSMLEKAPFRMKAMEKFAFLTKKIQRQQENINTIRGQQQMPPDPLGTPAPAQMQQGGSAGQIQQSGSPSSGALGQNSGSGSSGAIGS